MKSVSQACNSRATALQADGPMVASELTGLPPDLKEVSMSLTRLAPPAVRAAIVAGMLAPTCAAAALTPAAASAAPTGTAPCPAGSRPVQGVGIGCTTSQQNSFDDVAIIAVIALTGAGAFAIVRDTRGGAKRRRHRPSTQNALAKSA